MKKHLSLSILAVTLCLAIGCSFSTALGEIGGFISKFSPLLGLAEGAVCVISGPACAGVEAVVAIANPLAGQVSAAFGAWSAASEAAAPGKLNQLIAACQTWEDQLKKGFNIPGLSPSQEAQYQGVIQAELNMTIDVITLLQSTQASGGTQQAMMKVLDEATPIDEVDPLDQLASWNPARLVRKPRKLRLKNGAVIHTWEWHRSVLVARLGKKSGDAQADQYGQWCVNQVHKLR